MPKSLGYLLIKFILYAKNIRRVILNLKTHYMWLSVPCLISSVRQLLTKE